ncbi:MAG: DUF3365 domain-containing protein [Cyanobacteria bacterium P01_D01_bin.123]
MFVNLKIGRKFNLLLLLVFAIGLLMTAIAFQTVLNRVAEAEVTSKAEILLRTAVGVRDYTSSQVRPELVDRLATEPEFLPQTVPGYSAREVFENFREDSKYSDFFYKEATLNPTNLRDKADSFEAEIVKRFRENSNLDEQTGYRSYPGGDLYYIARPIQVKRESCLQCHSTPEVAPASMLTTYGRDRGFGWQLNEIVGAQMISVPASTIVTEARQSLFVLMGIVAITFTLAMLLTNVLLRKAVIRPLMRMANVADEVSTGKMDVEFEQTSNDEIGVLAAAFNRMRVSLAMAMNMLGQQDS